jgi:CxxC-x17-CxxC domain-containing protein
LPENRTVMLCKVSDGFARSVAYAHCSTYPRIEEEDMGKKTNLKSEKAKRNLEYALKFKKSKRTVRVTEGRVESYSPSFKPVTRDAADSHAAVCAQCGTDTTVPFKPTQGRPVLCRGCFQKAA